VRSARLLLALNALVLAAGVARVAVAGAGSGNHHRPPEPREVALAATHEHVPGPPPSTTSTSTSTTSTTQPAPVGPVALAGCPPPPHRPSTGIPHPWHPAVLVPESALPEPQPPAPRTAPLSALEGKGVWIWKYRLTEGGDARAIVDRAARAGLRQLWVRVGDSRDGFYASSVLDALVPLAHRRGIAVVGWGFPYLYDPVGDAGWTRAALDWRGADGTGLDAFSPDVETAGEGTALSERRAVLYLSLARAASAATRRPLVATVFPPTDRQLATYPFRAMAPYVDAFAPMVYWGCREPGDAAAAAVSRLAPLAPVHPIGQAYDMADEGGRVGSPSGDEIRRFLDVARRNGAKGASLWDWQEMTGEEWTALGASFWPVTVPALAPAPAP